MWSKCLLIFCTLSTTAVQGADLLRPPQKTASTAQGKYTKAQEVSTCTLSFQLTPYHSSPQWKAHKTQPLWSNRRQIVSPGKFSLSINCAKTSLLEHGSYSRPYCQLFIMAETSTISISIFRTLFLTKQNKQTYPEL